MFCIFVSKITIPKVISLQTSSSRKKKRTLLTKNLVFSFFLVLYAFSPPVTEICTREIMLEKGLLSLFPTTQSATMPFTLGSDWNRALGGGTMPFPSIWPVFCLKWPTFVTFWWVAETMFSDSVSVGMFLICSRCPQYFFWWLCLFPWRASLCPLPWCTR